MKQSKPWCPALVNPRKIWLTSSCPKSKAKLSQKGHFLNKDYVAASHERSLSAQEVLFENYFLLVVLLRAKWETCSINKFCLACGCFGRKRKAENMNMTQKFRPARKTIVWMKIVSCLVPTIKKGGIKCFQYLWVVFCWAWISKAGVCLKSDQNSNKSCFVELFWRWFLTTSFEFPREDYSTSIPFCLFKSRYLLHLVPGKH